MQLRSIAMPKGACIEMYKVQKFVYLHLTPCRLMVDLQHVILCRKHQIQRACELLLHDISRNIDRISAVRVDGLMQ